MAKNPCQLLHDAGTAVWMDQLSREIVERGTLTRFIEQAALTGVTSNPAIFEKAMASGTSYDSQLTELAGSKLTTEQVYEELAVRDIQLACDVLRPVFDRMGGADGFVSQRHGRDLSGGAASPRAGESAQSVHQDSGNEGRHGRDRAMPHRGHPHQHHAALRDRRV